MYKQFLVSIELLCPTFKNKGYDYRFSLVREIAQDFKKLTCVLKQTHL